jgi:hypothetical protein
VAEAGCHTAEFKSDIAKRLDTAIATFAGVYCPEGQNIVLKLNNVPNLLDQIADHHRRHTLMAHQKVKVKQLIESARWLSNRHRVRNERFNEYIYLFS